MDIVNIKIRRSGNRCAKRLTIRIAKTFRWIPWCERNHNELFFGWMFVCGFAYW
jgi:hypothetical protein